MGYLLRRWLADRLPAELGHGERAVALEFADQANDITRRAYSKDVLKIVAHRAGYADEKQVGAVLGKLAKRGIELRVQLVKNGKPFFDTSGRPVFACTNHETTYRIPTERECAALVPPTEDLPGAALTGPQDGLGPAPTGPKVPQTCQLGPATTGPFSSVTPQDQTSEKLLDPAVGELQHRTGESGPDLRPEIEEPDASDLIDDEPATTAPDQPAPSTTDLSLIWHAIPEQVRDRIRPHQQNEVLAAIRAELAAQYRSVPELLERVRRRWQWWQHMGERPGCPVKVAVTLVQRRPCPDVRCEDGTNLDTGRPCLPCADSRPLRPAAPSSTPPAPTSSSSRPDSRTVDEVLAPVPYIADDHEMPPAAPSRSSSGPHAAVAALRAAWAANGRHSPAQRRAITPTPVAVDEPDSPAALARAYLNRRGDLHVWMTRARGKLGQAAAVDEVILLAADLAKGQAA